VEPSCQRVRVESQAAVGQAQEGAERPSGGGCSVAELLRRVRGRGIGKQLSAHDISQRDCTAFLQRLVTYATRLLAQAPNLRFDHEAFCDEPYVHRKTPRLLSSRTQAAFLRAG
jgi:hypothetical protein